MTTERDFKSCSESNSDNSLLEYLFEELDVSDPNGVYDSESHTWTHRNWIQFSPVKQNQEM